MRPLDLTRRRDAWGLISTAFEVWWAHLSVFVLLAAIAVFPAIFLLDGVWSGHLADPDAAAPLEATIGSSIIIGLLVTPLVTAMHVLVVVELGRGEHPSIGRAVAEGLKILPWVAVAVLLYGLAVVLGLALLIVPGIFVAVACYFAAQATVVDGARGLGALRHSWALVKGCWWRTLGIVILLGITAAILALPLGYATQIVGALSDNGPLYVLGNAIAQTVSLSFTGLAGTLLFFDLKARQESPNLAPHLQAPERPLTEPA